MNLPAPQQENTPPTSRNHLSYIDGLRGMAALFVVISHAYMEVADKQAAELPFFVRHLTNWLAYGQVAVAIFIVLSGYCLMIPPANAGGELRGGASRYLFRRARRILPPYYASLILFLLLIAAVPGMNRIQGYRWDVALPALDAKVIASHLLMVHNFNIHWHFAINPPMWSVAPEWQIYFLFPFLLLPLWRRFGNAVTIAVAFALGLFPHFVLRRWDFSCPWFLGLFALGMAAAAVNVRLKSTPERSLGGYAVLSVLFLLAFVTATLTMAAWLWGHVYVMDTLTGSMTACFLIFCTGHCYRNAGMRPLVLRLLETPAAVRLGAFSYSLYLIHFPLLSLLHLGIRPLHLSATPELFLLIGAGVPLSLAASYLFHLIFERPFMSSPAPQTERQTEKAAVESPAP